MDRVHYIADLKNYIQQSKSELVSVADAVQSQKELKDSKQISLSNSNKFNERYVLMANKIKEHNRNTENSLKLKCSMENELPSTIPRSFLGHYKMAITIDDDMRLTLLKNTRMKDTLPAPPITSDDYFANYSPEERDILYKFVVANCVKVAAPPDLVLEEASECNLSENILTNENEKLLKLEKLKQDRDLKRRRQAYRRKVSTKNKSQTEVTREIIGNVMEALGYTNGQTSVTQVIDPEVKIEHNLETRKVPDIWSAPVENFDRFRFPGQYESRNFCNKGKYFKYDHLDRKRNREYEQNSSRGSNYNAKSIVRETDINSEKEFSSSTKFVENRERSKHSFIRKSHSHSDSFYDKHNKDRTRCDSSFKKDSRRDSYHRNDRNKGVSEKDNSKYNY